MRASLEPSRFVHTGDVDERYQSYNVEMAEVTGGTFWTPYTEAERSGAEPFGGTGAVTGSSSPAPVSRPPVSLREPVDLTDDRVRTLARALAPAHIRVSGSWASLTFFDRDGSTHGTPPAGYQAVLTRDQWDGVIDFARAVGATLVTSMANTEGAHDDTGAWNPANSRELLTYTLARGLPIAGAEFMNEPDLAGLHGAPTGYTPRDYGRDLAIFVRMLREVAPDALVLGPGTIFGREGGILPFDFEHLTIDDLLQAAADPPDVFTYHFYFGLSERGGGVGHVPADGVLTEEYLASTERAADGYRAVRDDYAPGAPMWLTETGDAALGGNTWGPTWLDVPRYVDQLGRLARRGVTCVMHNTLCASDYGMLDERTHQPRAKYWAAWMWARLMGTRVYDPGIPLGEGLHTYVHDRRNGPGFAAVLVNNSRTDETIVELPAGAEIYLLTGPELRGTAVACNGVPLAMVDDRTMPTVRGAPMSGEVRLPPVSVTFVTFP